VFTKSLISAIFSSISVMGPPPANKLFMISLFRFIPAPQKRRNRRIYDESVAPCRENVNNALAEPQRFLPFFSHKTENNKG
jgi:hypothetical protein